MTRVAIGRVAIGRVARCARYVGIVAFLWVGLADGTEVGALNHGEKCAQECDAHVGYQCPNPSEAWNHCVVTCLYQDCGGDPECVDSGIPGAAAWCASQPG